MQIVKELKSLNYEESLSYYASYVVRGTITQIEETKRIVFYDEKVFTLHFHITNVFKGEQKYLGKDILIDAYFNAREVDRYKKGMELVMALTDINEQMRGIPFDYGLTATWSTLGTVDQKRIMNSREIPSEKVMPLENIFSGFQSSEVYHSDAIFFGQGIELSESEVKMMLASTKDRFNYYTPYNLVSGFRVENVIKGDKTLEGKIIYFYNHFDKAVDSISPRVATSKSFDGQKWYLIGLKNIKKIEAIAPKGLNSGGAYYGGETQKSILNARLWGAYQVYLEQAKKGRIEIPKEIVRYLH